MLSSIISEHLFLSAYFSLAPFVEYPGILILFRPVAVVSLSVVYFAVAYSQAFVYQYTGLVLSIILLGIAAVFSFALTGVSSRINVGAVGGTCEVFASSCVLF